MPLPRPTGPARVGFPAIVALLFALSSLVSIGVFLLPDFGATTGGLGADATPSARSGPRTRVGINPGGVNDYGGDRLFADAVKCSRGFNAPDAPWNHEKPVPVDEAGWPRADFGLLLAMGPKEANYRPDLNGTYGVRFVGQATIGGWLTQVVVRDQHYDPATNTTTALIDAVAQPEFGGISLNFTGTHRLPTDGPGTGLVGVQVMRPIAVGSKTPHGFDEVFSRPALQMLAPFAFQRNLDLNATNLGGIERAPWSARRRPTAPVQSSYGNDREIAYEYQVALANASGVDLWMTVHFHADDDHIRRLFQLCRYGSDGVNPYTSDQAKPAYAPLRGRLIIEFDNELWNYGFPHAHANRSAAVAEVKEGRSNIGRDGDSSMWASRRVARQTVRLRDLAAEVYGEDAFGVRFLPVLMGQQGGQDNTNFFHLKLGLDDLRTHDRRPLNRLLAAAGTSWYHFPPVLAAANARFEEAKQAAAKVGAKAPTWTWPKPEAVFATGPSGQFPAIRSLGRLLRDYNLPMACYEGGEVFEHFGPSDDPEVRLVQGDPRFGLFVRSTINQAIAEGPAFLAIYNTTQPPWGLVDSSANLKKVKYTATVEAIRGHDAGPETGPSAAPGVTPPPPSASGR